MKTFLFSLSALFAVGVVNGADKIVVQTVNYPLTYFAERIATDAFTIEYRVDPDVDPAFWKPGDDDIAAFQQADVILLNGADYAKWIDKVTLPKSIMVDTSKEFADHLIEVEGKAHRHGDGEVHSHAGTAFTTWLDFSQAKQQATAIAKKFRALAPDHAETLDENLAKLHADLDKLDAKMKEFGKAWGDEPLAASHPVYEYLGRAYGLEIVPLEWEPQMDWDGKAKHDLEHVLEKHPVRWLIWEGEPAMDLVEGIEKMGIKSVVFVPGGNKPDAGDWWTLMEQNIDNLEAMLEARQ